VKKKKRKMCYFVPEVYSNEQLALEEKFYQACGWLKGVTKVSGAKGVKSHATLQPV